MATPPTVRAVAAEATPAGKPNTLVAKMATIEVSPMDAVIYGGVVVAAGAALTAISTYRSGTKGLVEDGINPATRVQMIPLAAKALMLSTVLTGCFGVAGFYALKTGGFFSMDRAELPNVQEAARLIRDPQSFFRQLLSDGEASGSRPAAEAAAASAATGDAPPAAAGATGSAAGAPSAGRA